MDRMTCDEVFGLMTIARRPVREQALSSSTSIFAIDDLRLRYRNPCTYVRSESKACAAQSPCSADSLFVLRDRVEKSAAKRCLYHGAVYCPFRTKVKASSPISPA